MTRMSIPTFSDTVTRFWARPFEGTELFRDERLSLISNPGLGAGERVTLLRTAGDHHTAVAVRPEIAEQLRSRGVGTGASVLSEPQLRRALSDLGILLHDADNVFYFPAGHPAREGLAEAGDGYVVRVLTAADSGLFADFTQRASEQDLDDAQVELEDWAVCGVIAPSGAPNGSRDRLVAAASTYPWRDSRLADIGVLTLATERGKGHGRRLVTAMARHALEQDHELQYRCQLDNAGSNALAHAAGLQLWGRWEVPTP
ncbi:GNAT family N-acetyltransferase [Galactobacter caseinivorans]|uniref:GNAT family N-acetyltransferase n=1 Tax=Galactobacter caseinivorans TaxID=2676123 RepID=A0A496PME1_9MICC|nr:GNAT family N-acetyltransferase [Galactobacter caseinivorans]RKW71711.1 GNAT family N-acetyltransferase [Galactobacter caseinivorans]